jgi:hypothetical protein
MALYTFIDFRKHLGLPVHAQGVIKGERAELGGAS